MSVFYSVIIPCYNIADYVGECIDSVLSQDFDDYEIIAVDDGSTDEKTPAILDEYAKKDARVKVIYKENGGVASARNAGLAEAKGEYLIFLDSDDYLASSYLDLAHGEIERERERWWGCRPSHFFIPHDTKRQCERYSHIR